MKYAMELTLQVGIPGEYIALGITLNIVVQDYTSQCINLKCRFVSNLGRMQNNYVAAVGGYMLIDTATLYWRNSNTLITILYQILKDFNVDFEFTMLGY